MSNETKHEPKPELAHDEGSDGIDGGRTNKLGELLSKRDAVKDGDLGAKWLEDYTGERRELTDDDNNRIRNRVSGP